jgi:hypothetical protein
MKEIKLTDRQYSEIKSNSISQWVNYGKGDNGLVIAVVESLIGFCNKNGYIIQDGKVLQKDEEKEQKRNS